jgi:hypothetical protein
MQAVPESSGELGTSVRDNYLGNSMEADYTGKIKLGQASSIEDSLDGYEVIYLGEAIYNNPDGIVTSV